MTKARLRALENDLLTLRAKHRELEDNYKRVYDDREELKHKFESALHEAMDVVGERNAELQHRLLEADSKVEEREAQFRGVLMAMNL